jgi:hypothetical protein
MVAAIPKNGLGFVLIKKITEINLLEEKVVENKFRDFLLNEKFDYELSEKIKSDGFSNEFLYSSFQEAEDTFLKNISNGDVVKIGYPQLLKLGWAQKVGDVYEKHIISLQSVKGQ